MNNKLLSAYAANMPGKATRADARVAITEVVMRVARNLAPSYRFGYHDVADIEQLAMVIALEVLRAGKYDPTRPLENFLHVHVRRRLFNHKRDHFFRAEAPCRCCDAFGEPTDPCRRWKEWHARNSSKQNLMRPLDVAGVCDEGERNMSTAAAAADEAEASDLRARLDEGLPADLRADYLRMLAGVPVPKGRRHKVREAAMEVLGGRP